ncbi:hypothetical protein [Taklimakanibacter lacteus]|uniref:hypothetical protein n=1 Tax=Taklimakanibacter lacteus TaxID=2268456 RepID=UPI0013C467D8
MSMKRSLRREFVGALVDTARHFSHFVDRRAQRLGLTGAQIRVLRSRREAMPDRLPAE